VVLEREKLARYARLEAVQVAERREQLAAVGSGSQILLLQQPRLDEALHHTVIARLHYDPVLPEAVKP
jgi:hypothetical protein